MLHKLFRDWADKRLIKFIYSFCLKNGIRTIHDCGCGSGRVGLSLEKKLGISRVCLSDLNHPINDKGICDLDANEKLPFDDGAFDLTISSNLLEHLKFPMTHLIESGRTSKWLYISFTPWYSPYGGHDFSPWHYFGKTEGKCCKLGKNLFKLTVSGAIEMIRNAGYKIVILRPRYYPWFLHWLARIPIVKEFATWNIEIVAKYEKY